MLEGERLDLHTGLKDAARVRKEAALEALRQRDDFRRLLLRLEGESKP